MYNNAYEKGEKMPVFLILACEIAVFSFLIGAFLGSVLLGLIILFLYGIAMYFLFQEFYTPLPFVWGATLLASIATLLWASYIDIWLGTAFMTVLLTPLSGTLCYLLNNSFLRRYYG